MSPARIGQTYASAVISHFSSASLSVAADWNWLNPFLYPPEKNKTLRLVPLLPNLAVLYGSDQHWLTFGLPVPTLSCNQQPGQSSETVVLSFSEISDALDNEDILCSGFESAWASMSKALKPVIMHIWRHVLQIK